MFNLICINSSEVFFVTYCFNLFMFFYNTFYFSSLFLSSLNPLIVLKNSILF